MTWPQRQLKGHKLLGFSDMARYLISQRASWVCTLAIALVFAVLGTSR